MIIEKEKINYKELDEIVAEVFNICPELVEDNELCIHIDVNSMSDMALFHILNIASNLINFNLYYNIGLIAWIKLKRKNRNIEIKRKRKSHITGSTLKAMLSEKFSNITDKLETIYYEYYTQESHD